MPDKNVAIKVENISKTFRIPREKISTLKGAFVSALKSKGYEEFKALDNVSFEVKKGEFFGIIGRNGSGKSTLLKVLAGIYQSDGGRITVNGRISPFLELGIGFNPELSGRDNIHLNAAVLGLSHKQINEKFDDIVEFSELRRFIDQKVKNYSSGMQVRLAFSVAIHANRDILLMDEVLAVGDSNFQSKCVSEFTKYKHLGKTVVLVTHDIMTVQKYCDRAMLLREGKIQLIGSPEKVGNEYVYQNMSDEEKRLFEEEKDRRSKAEKDLEIRKREEKKKDAIGKGNDQDNKDNRKIDETIELRGEIVEIVNVQFFNEKRKNKRVFLSGEDVVVRIHYQIKNGGIINKPVFGLAIHDQNGNHIFGAYSRNSGYSIRKIAGKNFIDFIIKDNAFHSGEYFTTAAIYNWNQTLPFDRKIKKYSFKVISGNLNQFGIIGLRHKWKMGGYN